MYIIVKKAWHESYTDKYGRVYNAIIDEDKDNMVKINDKGEIFYSHMLPGPILEYLPVPKGTEIIFTEETVRCNNCMKIMPATKVKIRDDKEYCPCCGKKGYLMDLEIPYQHIYGKEQ